MEEGEKEREGRREQRDGRTKEIGSEGGTEVGLALNKWLIQNLTMAASFRSRLRRSRVQADTSSGTCFGFAALFDSAGLGPG